MNIEEVRPYFSGKRKYRCDKCNTDEQLYQLRTNRKHYYCSGCDLIHHFREGKILASVMSCSYSICYVCDRM